MRVSRTAVPGRRLRADCVLPPAGLLFTGAPVAVRVPLPGRELDSEVFLQTFLEKYVSWGT